MSEVRFRPCEIADLEDAISWINELPVDIPLRRQVPLDALLNDVRAHTEVLAARLEAGVVVHGDAQREAVRALYLATRRQLEAIAVALDALGADC
jgi:hypothetical protein